MMKKITFLIVALVVGFTTNAQQTLSHSTDQTIASGMVACANSAGGYSTENSYWRTYTPTDFGFTGDFDIMGVDFALAFSDNGGTDPTMDIIVNIYSTDATFPGGNLTLLDSKLMQVTAADDLTMIVVEYDTYTTVDAGDEVVVEVFMEHGELDVVDFRIAGNELGEDAPGYISSDSCGITSPTTYADIGFPDSHMIINLVGDTAASIADAVIDGFSMYPNPVIDVLNLKANTNIDAVSIFNMLGQKVIQTTNTQIDMSALPSGSYIVKVNAGEQVGAYNFIKQ